MAIRHDAIGDKISTSASLPAVNAAYTVMGWYYMVNDRAAESVLWQCRGSAFTGMWAELSTDGHTLRLWSENSVTGTTGSVLSTATWYHIAMTRAASSTSYTLFLNGVSDITKVDSTKAITSMAVGNNSATTLWFDGRYCALKMWDGTALTAKDILQEMRQIAPVNTTNLSRFHPAIQHGDINTDYSGNARNWTTAGTLTTEDNPPIPWRVTQRRFIPTTSANVTAALAGVAGTTGVGAMLASLSLALAGISATAGVGTISPSPSYAVTGNVATSGVGAVAPSLGYTITGLAGTSGVGTLAAQDALALSGLAGTSGTGTVLAADGLSITGLSGTGSVGAMLAAPSLPLTGLAVTSAAGDVVASAGLPATSPGVGTGQVGVVGPQVSFALVGVAGTTASGDVGYSATSRRAIMSGVRTLFQMLTRGFRT